MNVDIKFTDLKTFLKFFSENRHLAFQEDFDFNIEAVLTEDELHKRNANFTNLDKLERYYLLAQRGDKLLGWSFGIQKKDDTFYMINSAVLPNYQKQGIYTKMLSKVVKHLEDKGYQHIYSHHKMDNNAVIIAKLKFGFVITGMNVNDEFGNLVQLSYYTNPKRRELLSVRNGTKKPSHDILKLIG